MKKHLLIVLLFAACNSPAPIIKVQDTVKTVSTLDTAKIVAKKILDYVELTEEKHLTKKQLDKIAKPLQHQLDSMRVLLSPEEIRQLDVYRTQLVSEMVDKKVQRDN